MKKKSSSDIISTGIMHLILLLFAAACILPLIAIVSISLSDEIDIGRYGYKLIPDHFSTLAYKMIFENPAQILNSYAVSITVTALGTVIALSTVSMMAYALAKNDFAYKNQFSFFIFFTLLFNGGLVPWYILISRYLRLSNTIWALILPYMANAWYILLLRTYFQEIPTSLFEAAKIDGASEFRTFFSIAIPLSKPAIATIGLFIVLHYWNDWWLSMLFIEKENLVPLQYMLYRIMANIQFLTTQMQTTAVSFDIKSLPNESARMAMAIIAAGPMLFIFPFFQKYFVKGLTVGAIKG